MADDELLQTLQAKENAFIFSELEHEMLDDEFVSPKHALHACAYAISLFVFKGSTQE